MGGTEQTRMAAFADGVRNSTLKRLKRVPEGSENWAITAGAMSFADLAHHIIQCDKALLKVFETKHIGKNVGETGQMRVKDREEFNALVQELHDLRRIRSEFIEDFTDADFDVLIDADRIRGVERIPAGLLILETLDHEVHHRGQLAVYLRVLEAARAAVA